MNSSRRLTAILKKRCARNLIQNWSIRSFSTLIISTFLRSKIPPILPTADASAWSLAPWIPVWFREPLLLTWALNRTPIASNWTYPMTLRIEVNLNLPRTEVQVAASQLVICSKVRLITKSSITPWLISCQESSVLLRVSILTWAVLATAPARVIQRASNRRKALRRSTN